MPLQVGFNVEPAEAVRFFRGKGLARSFAWQDVLHDEHDRDFVVAKMLDLDLLSDVRALIDRALAEGWLRDRFVKELTPELVRRGWWGRQEMVDPDTGESQMVQLGSVRRLKVIYDTNLRTAYAAGQWGRIRENAQRAPYVMYSAILDERVRPLHRAWHGTILRWDDPWWATHTPPNGWNCRCSVRQLSDRDLDRLGRTADRAPETKTYEWTNPRSGEIFRIPEGIDPGWGYAPGATRAAEIIPIARDKAAGAPPELRAAFLEWLDSRIERRARERAAR